MLYSKMDVIILAGGLGKRMKSNLPKVLHTIFDIPLIVYVMNAVLTMNQTLDDLMFHVIVNPSNVKAIKEVVLKAYPQLVDQINFVIQNPPLGTGHAVLQVLPFLNKPTNKVLVLSGDVPLISSKTLQNLLTIYSTTLCSATVLTTRFSNPTGYGRIVRDDDANFMEIVEEKDISTEAVRNIKEVNAGIYLFHAASLIKYLPFIDNNNANAEYYLPDVLSLLTVNGNKISCFCLSEDDNHELININDQETLLLAKQILIDKSFVVVN